MMRTVAVVKVCKPNSFYCRMQKRYRQTMLRFKSAASVLIALSFLAMANVSLAQGVVVGEHQFDVISLSAESEIEVDNDLISVTLVAQSTGKDSAALANEINASMGWAVAKLKAYPSITSRTLNYQTYPKYERNGTRINAWVASQSIQIESDDFEKATKAIQVLQERLQVQGMQLKAKPETRKKAEDQLINTAMDAFKARALLVQLNMGATGYRVMNMSINTSGSRYFPKVTRQSRAESDRALSSAPVIEGGSSTVSVSISGQIQLE